MLRVENTEMTTCNSRCTYLSITLIIDDFS